VPTAAARTDRTCGRRPGRDAQASGGITTITEGDLAKLDTDVEADQDSDGAAHTFSVGTVMSIPALMPTASTCFSDSEII